MSRIRYMSEKYDFDRAKFSSLVLYVCSTSKPEDLGATKLHKILYFVDMLHFLETGTPLTGEAYFKNNFGPTSRNLNAVLRRLTAEGKILVSLVEYFGRPKKQFIANQESEREKFSEDEISLIEVVKEFVCNRHTAASISELSHNRAWELAEMGENLPYFTAYQMVPREITEEDIAWAVEKGMALAG